MVKDLSFNDIIIQLGWYLLVLVKRYIYNILQVKMFGLQINLCVVKLYLIINVYKK